MGITSSSNGARLNHSALSSPLAVGDTIRIATGSIRATDDGLHPRTGVPDNSSSTSKGGQLLLVNETRNWIDARLA